MTWSWQGAAAVIVAAPLAVGWSVAVVVAAMDPTPISADASALLATVGGGLVTVVAGFVGAEYGRRHPAEDDR